MPTTNKRFSDLTGLEKARFVITVLLLFAVIWLVLQLGSLKDQIGTIKDGQTLGRERTCAIIQHFDIKNTNCDQK